MAKSSADAVLIAVKKDGFCGYAVMQAGLDQLQTMVQYPHFQGYPALTQDRAKQAVEVCISEAIDSHVKDPAAWTDKYSDQESCDEYVSRILKLPDYEAWATQVEFELFGNKHNIEYRIIHDDGDQKKKGHDRINICTGLFEGIREWVMFPVLKNCHYSIGGTKNGLGDVQIIFRREEASAVERLLIASLSGLIEQELPIAACFKQGASPNTNRWQSQGKQRNSFNKIQHRQLKLQETRPRSNSSSINDAGSRTTTASPPPVKEGFSWEYNRAYYKKNNEMEETGEVGEQGSTTITNSTSTPPPVTEGFSSDCSAWAGVNFGNEDKEKDEMEEAREVGKQGSTTSATTTTTTTTIDFLGFCGI